MRPLEVELFHADGRTDRQTDMMKLIVAFETLRTGPKSVQNWEILRTALGSEENFHWGQLLHCACGFGNISLLRPYVLWKSVMRSERIHRIQSTFICTCFVSLASKRISITPVFGIYTSSRLAKMFQNCGVNITWNCIMSWNRQQVPTFWSAPQFLLRSFPIHGVNNQWNYTFKLARVQGV